MEKWFSSGNTQRKFAVEAETEYGPRLRVVSENKNVSTEDKFSRFDVVTNEHGYLQLVKKDQRRQQIEVSAEVRGDQKIEEIAVLKQEEVDMGRRSFLKKAAIASVAVAGGVALDVVLETESSLEKVENVTAPFSASPISVEVGDSREIEEVDKLDQAGEIEDSAG